MGKSSGTIIFDEKKHGFVEGAKYRANGGIRKQHGVEAEKQPRHIRLYPVSEKGKVSSSFLDIPIDSVDLFIETLNHLKNVKQ
jgi:hypothetical protein